MGVSRRKKRIRKLLNPTFLKRQRRKQQELKDKRTIVDAIDRLTDRRGLGKVTMTFDGVEISGFADDTPVFLTYTPTEPKP